MMYLIEKFTPLIKHYANKLHTEDAVADLTLSFIELIHNIDIKKLRNTQDGAIVNYLSTSMKNAYVVSLRKIMNKKETLTISWDGLTEHEQNSSVLPDTDSFHLRNSFSDLLTACTILTEKERNILILVYQHDLPSTEIARQMKTSKQNINQIKLRAIKKLRSCVT